MNNPIISLDKVSVSFEGRAVLQDISFELPEGAFLAIIGPNGAGKTTLLKSMLGLIKPDSGSILLNGKSPEETSNNFFSYVPQFKSMNRSFPAYVWEVVYSGYGHAWPWRATEKRVALAKSALEKAGAGHLLHRQITRISGGELQRVCLARSIIKNPSLIFLDEPATGIDVVGEADLYKLLDNYQRESNITIVMITHDWQVARHHASHIIIMNRRMISFGVSSEVLNERNLREAFGHLGHDHPYQKERFLNV
jgi:zinc transport system ATP-binding protein